MPRTWPEEVVGLSEEKMERRLEGTLNSGKPLETKKAHKAKAPTRIALENSENAQEFFSHTPRFFLQKNQLLKNWSLNLS